MGRPVAELASAAADWLEREMGRPIVRHEWDGPGFSRTETWDIPHVFPASCWSWQGAFRTAREIVPARGGLVQKNGEHTKPYDSLSSVGVTTL